METLTDSGTHDHCWRNSTKNTPSSTEMMPGTSQTPLMMMMMMRLVVMMQMMRKTSTSMRSPMILVAPFPLLSSLNLI